VREGEKFGGAGRGRYRVTGKLGWGHFSTVWRVREEGGPRAGRELALKVQKSAAHYAEAARDEIELLRQVARGWGPDRPPETLPVVLLEDSFEHSGPHGRHVCMVFEKLGDNLLELIKRFDYRGLPLAVVRMLTRETLRGLDFLHRELKIIHTDLKPENILLTRPLPPLRGGRRRAAGAHAGGGPPAGPGQGPGGGPVEGEPKGLTKNQRKKLRRKQKKAREREQAGGAPPDAEVEPEPEPESGLEPEPEREARGAQEAELPPGNPAGDSGGDGEAEPRAAYTLADWVAAPGSCKIVDLGNACWTYKQFTADIQTRQYRSPEVIIGARYSTSADIWSLACMIFELVTGDLLFDPKTDAGGKYSRDEDHLALMIELVGPFPKKFALSGKRSKEFFNRDAELRRIKELNVWPLENVLADKYSFPQEEAAAFAAFLAPMLHPVPDKRIEAAEALEHPWIDAVLHS